MTSTPEPSQAQRAETLLIALKGPVRLGHTRLSFDRGVQQILEALSDAEHRGAARLARLEQLIDPVMEWIGCTPQTEQGRRECELCKEYLEDYFAEQDAQRPVTGEEGT